MDWDKFNNLMAQIPSLISFGRETEAKGKIEELKNFLVANSSMPSDIKRNAETKIRYWELVLKIEVSEIAAVRRESLETREMVQGAIKVLRESQSQIGRLIENLEKRLSDL